MHLAAKGATERMVTLLALVPLMALETVWRNASSHARELLKYVALMLPKT